MKRSAQWYLTKYSNNIDIKHWRTGLYLILFLFAAPLATAHEGRHKDSATTIDSISRPLEQYANGTSSTLDKPTGDVQAPPAVSRGLPERFEDQLVLDGLRQPVDIISLPSDQMLILERAGRIVATDVFGETGVGENYLSLPEVDSTGEKGLLSIALDPNFSANGYLYLYYHNSATDRARVSRFTHAGDHALADTEFVIWEDDVAASTQTVPDHWGGAFDFGPDGHLYLAIGDKKDFPEQSQDLSLIAGKLLRLNVRGADSGFGEWVRGAENRHLVPRDNPFIDGPGGHLDEIWALGLRNPFRGRWQGNRLLISEVGGNVQSGVDASHEDIHSVTVTDAGVNFGWPNCEGPVCRNAQPTLYSPPLFSIKHPDSRAIVAGPIYTAGQFPSEFQGAFFFTDYVIGWLRYLKFDSTGQVADDTPVGGFRFASNRDLGNPVALTTGADGALYYADIVRGQLRRIRYISGNESPRIVTITAETQGRTSAPLLVQFSARAIDDDSATLEYHWDFGDGTQAEGKNVTHIYTAIGIFEVTLSVSDGHNQTTSDPLRITVGEIPKVRVSATSHDQLFRAAETIELLGEISSETAGLPQTRWTIEFLHDDHAHPVLTDVSGTDCASSGFTCLQFEIPDFGHDFSGDTAYRIELTATDANGLEGLDHLIIRPEKVDLRFEANVPGVETLTLDQLPRTLPFVHDTLVGFHHTIEAPEQVSVDGQHYRFARWSSGNTTRRLNLTVQAAPTTYRAEYASDVFSSRVTRGLQAIYRFDEGVGDRVFDTAGGDTPLDLIISDPKKVQWGGGVLNITEPATIRSAGFAAAIINAVQQSDEVSVEAWISPANTVQSGPARIVTLSPDSSAQNLTVGQGAAANIAGDRYDVRLRTTQTGPNAAAFSTRSLPGSATRALTHVLFTRSAAGIATLYINSNVAATQTIEGTLANWSSDYPLLLANENDGSLPWLGRYHLVALYDRALSAQEVSDNFLAGSGDEPGANPRGPTANDDAATVLFGSSVLINVLDNDTNIAGEKIVTAVSVNLTQQGARGHADVNADGTIMYTHHGVDLTPDRLHYTLIDEWGAASNVGTVYVSVTDGMARTTSRGSGEISFLMLGLLAGFGICRQRCGR